VLGECRLAAVGYGPWVAERDQAVVGGGDQVACHRLGANPMRDPVGRDDDPDRPAIITIGGPAVF